MLPVRTKLSVYGCMILHSATILGCVFEEAHVRNKLCALLDDFLSLRIGHIVDGLEDSYRKPGSQSDSY